MNTVNQRIKKMRLSKGMTLLDVAEKLGVKEATVQRYESGNIKNIKYETIEALAEIFSCSPQHLMGWDNVDTPFSHPDILPIKTKKWRVIGDIACGEPIYANEDFDSYIEAGADINADFCVRAKGDSMINARINDGDIVFIRKQPMVENGQIAAVVIEDGVTLKRFYKHGNKVVLSPENPAHEPLVYTNEELEQIYILGKAVAFQSDL